MSVLSRFCLNMAANVGLQYAAELLPTPIRTQGVSLIHIFGIIAHSLAPYVVDTVNRVLRFVRFTRFARRNHPKAPRTTALVSGQDLAGIADDAHRHRVPYGCYRHTVPTGDAWSRLTADSTPGRGIWQGSELLAATLLRQSALEPTSTLSSKRDIEPCLISPRSSPRNDPRKRS